jgi:selenocysteine lyase/cysteine desulfurase
MIERWLKDEALRQHDFPVAKHRVFMAHAGVTALPRVAVEALNQFAEAGSADNQESMSVWPRVDRCRRVAAQLLGCSATEISLLGPTALGLNLVAQGLPWEPGDEVVYYQDDYPANVYPWMSLAERGVQPVVLKPVHPGLITWPLVEAALTPRTRLVALASCHFLGGYRIDLESIGRELSRRDVLFCVDGIQSVGAGPLSVEHVDFLSADSHKWMLGPVAAGLFYVKASRRELLKPSLLGSWNVVSPEFIAQETIAFEPGGRRYEPGTLNLPGILGMMASMEMLLEINLDAIAERNRLLRSILLSELLPLGYTLVGDPVGGSADWALQHQTSIVTFDHPSIDLRKVAERLDANRVSISLRENREGRALVRVSPNFYNTEEELGRLVGLLKETVP